MMVWHLKNKNNSEFELMLETLFALQIIDGKYAYYGYRNRN